MLIRLGLIDEKGEPNVIPLAYYFDDISNKIYINTLKKICSLRKKNVIAYCIDGYNGTEAPSPGTPTQDVYGFPKHQDHANECTRLGKEILNWVLNEMLLLLVM